MFKIKQRLAQKRGCGYRVPGGVYAVVRPSPDGRPITHFLHEPMPLLDEVQTVLQQNIAPRGVTLVEVNEETAIAVDWVGMKYYPTPAHFLDEARRLGVSRRIPKKVARKAIGYKTLILTLIHPVAGVAPEEIHDANKAIHAFWKDFFPHYAGCRMLEFPCADEHLKAHRTAPAEHQCSNFLWLVPGEYIAQGFERLATYQLIPWNGKRVPAVFFSIAIPKLEVVVGANGEGREVAEEMIGLAREKGNLPVEAVTDVIPSGEEES